MATQSSKLYLPPHKLTIVLDTRCLKLGIRRKLGLLTLIIMTSLWKLLSLPRVLSLRIKRFRAVSGQRTRNESQRSKNRASKRAGENPVPRSSFAPKSLLHRLSDPPPLHVFCLISTKTTIVVISYEDVFRVSSLVPSRCAKIVLFNCSWLAKRTSQWSQWKIMLFNSTIKTIYFIRPSRIAVLQL